METVTLAPHLAAELVAPSDVAAQTDVAGVKAAVPDSVEQVCCWIHAAGISFANHNPNQHRLTFNAFPVIAGGIGDCRGNKSGSWSGE